MNPTRTLATILLLLGGSAGSAAADRVIGLGLGAHAMASDTSSSLALEVGALTTVRVTWERDRLPQPADGIAHGWSVSPEVVLGDGAYDYGRDGVLLLGGGRLQLDLAEAKQTMSQGNLYLAARAGGWTGAERAVVDLGLGAIAWAASSRVRIGGELGVMGWRERRELEAVPTQAAAGGAPADERRTVLGVHLGLELGVTL
ncbi:MAG: hypothetical protein R2939_00420 [Kofleriaceae bacterium]